MSRMPKGESPYGLYFPISSGLNKLMFLQLFFLEQGVGTLLKDFGPST